MRSEIEALIAGKPGSPFLFVGSGFSRRYIGLDDWPSLLRRFCDGLKDYEYYRATANNDLPAVASLIAADFHTAWWTEERFSNSRENFKERISGQESALKLEISLHIQNYSLEPIDDEKIRAELEALKQVNVDGIITTNWDLLLEEIFPEYRVFVGQDELLFSNPQSIAEIYKIHGSCNSPESLVLTKSDYELFKERNPYLAAKLITIFIEHPIFFIGYSVNDPHISDLIFSIASCLNEEKIGVFSENLIFVRRSGNGKDSIQKHAFSRDGRNITATVLETDDFEQIFSVISENKRKIPARILRYCKEQMFELVKSSNPQEKLAVLDIEDIEEKEEVEFVVGVGVAAAANEHAQSQDEAHLAESGYIGIERNDLLRDVVKTSSEFDGSKIAEFVFPKLLRTGLKFHPIFRYLRDAGIESEAALDASEFEAAKKLYRKVKDGNYQYQSTYRASYYKNYADLSAEDLLDRVGYEKAAIYLAYLDREKLDQRWLADFINSNFDKEFRDPYESAFKKLICYYDKLYFGFDPVEGSEIIAGIVEGEVAAKK